MVLKFDRFGAFAEYFSQMDSIALQRIGLPIVNSFTLLTPQEEQTFKHKILDPECFEVMRLPVVHGLSKGGSLSLYKKEITLFRFDNAIFHPFSDVIRINDRAYWDKLSRPQLAKTIFQDKDIVRLDVESNKIFLKSYPVGTKIDVGFGLCGVHVTSWGHFIGNFLPKIVALESIKDESNIKIIVPDTVDDHIRELVTRSLKLIGDFEVVYVKNNLLVECRKIYYCNAPSFIADHAAYITSADTQITTYSVDAIRKFVDNIVRTIDPGTTRRLYIGRRGIRNLINAKEVEDYFVAKGFTIVFPHLLSFDDKVELFSNASHVCGPGSSGFQNIVFCKPGTKILTFTNYACGQDAYSFAFGARDFELSICILTGVGPKSGSPHDSYTISLDKIRDCLRDTKFLD